jgi:hypothetical protein
MAANVAGAAGAALAGGRGLRRLAAANLAAQLVYVLGGMAFVRAPLSAYRGLALAPLLVVRKLAMLRRVVSGEGPTTFVRTERTVRSAGP